MNRLLITRQSDDGVRTFGEASFLGHEWVSLERPWLNNQDDISCIPTGTYIAQIYDSPTKGNVYLLQNVPGRSWVEIHAANWVHELLGCISLSMSRGFLNGEPAGINSREAIKEFMGLAQGQPIEVVIT